MPMGRRIETVVVRPTRSVLSALVEAGLSDKEARAALARGAVFADGRRLKDPAAPLVAGARLTCSIDAGGPLVVADNDLVYLDEDLVGVCKTAGTVVYGDLTGDQDTLERAVARHVDPEGAAPLHAIGRLDRLVSGIVVFARTARARKALVEARRAWRIERVYVAITRPGPALDRGIVDAPIGKRARNPRQRQVVAAGVPGAERAVSRYEVRERAGGAAWLEVRPETGRTHQIRVHLGHAGAPIVGDATYGGARTLTLGDGAVVEIPQILLHAWRVTLPHPARGETLTLSCPLPAAFAELWARLKGGPRG